MALVPNTLLQNAVVEEDAMAVIIHIVDMTEYIDVKVRKNAGSIDGSIGHLI